MPPKETLPGAMGNGAGGVEFGPRETLSNADMGDRLVLAAQF